MPKEMAEQIDHQAPDQPLDQAFDHDPRPILPEDSSYREVMMLFSDQPVKPKYWFEEFGDSWTCSCGQFNKGDTCSNCGLDRDLLRRLFVVHRAAKGGDGFVPAGEGDPLPEQPEGESAGEGPQADEDSSGNGGSGASAPPPRKNKGCAIRMLVITIILLLILGCALAAFYYIFLPDIQAKDESRTKEIETHLTTALPEVLAPLHIISQETWLIAGDTMYDEKKFEKAVEYYVKYRDAKEGGKKDKTLQKKILAAKFGYVSNTSDKGGKTFRRYMKDLLKAKYPGVQEIYDSTYKWSADIVSNNTAGDNTTDLSAVERDYTIYFHCTLTGGPPDVKIPLHYIVTWPNGSTDRGSIAGTYANGEDVTIRCNYTYPHKASDGDISVKLYNSNDHQVLATDSAQVLP